MHIMKLANTHGFKKNTKQLSILVLEMFREEFSWEELRNLGQRFNVLFPPDPLPSHLIPPQKI